jgi:HlyD family secretion protein
MAISSTACSKPDINKTEEKVLKEVTVLAINKNSNNSSFVKTSGAVRAKTQIDITATGKGTVRGIYFDIGDQVKINKILASLYNNATLTSLNNAQTNHDNMQSSLGATARINNETIRQAELGIQAAIEQVESAEIRLKSAIDNIDNSKALREKGNLDTKNQAIISFENYMNTVDDILDDVNYIIHVDTSEPQQSGIANVLSAENKSALLAAKTNYRKTESEYLILDSKNTDSENITTRIREIDHLLAITKILTKDIITVLENTVTSSDFSNTTLDSIRADFTAKRNNISGYQTVAKSILQNLQNLGLGYNQEIDTLDNAVASAENALVSANTNHENALINLENAKQGTGQQIISSQSSLDNARGQLNLARVQAGDLSIKAPISGQITQKYIELGAEINPGQKIAQISDTNTIKIEVDLPSNDIYRIDKDGDVKIGENLTGKISSISPTADSFTKKVRIEILFDNSKKDLIPETFIDCFIPTKKRVMTSANSVYIPIKAVNVLQNESVVFILNNNIVKKVIVKTGKADGKMIEIVEGLNQDDQIIIDGNKSIEDGEEVVLIEV